MSVSGLEIPYSMTCKKAAAPCGHCHQSLAKSCALLYPTAFCSFFLPSAVYCRLAGLTCHHRALRAGRPEKTSSAGLCEDIDGQDHHFHYCGHCYLGLSLSWRVFEVIVKIHGLHILIRSPSSVPPDGLVSVCVRIHM